MVPVFEPQSEADLKAHYRAVQGRLFAPRLSKPVEPEKAAPEPPEPQEPATAERRVYIHNEKALADLAAIARGQVAILILRAGAPKERVIPLVRAVVSGIAVKHGARSENVFGPSRRAHIVRARQEAMFVIKDALGWSLTKIGRFFDRDHTTVLHALRREAARTHVRQDTAHEPSQTQPVSSAHDRLRSMASETMERTDGWSSRDGHFIQGTGA